MHAIKGGWIGQAFALAASNDSGGRKSRIRRSKEERKEMAESYIKKYQNLNDGSFPSLNLTHKEVGGSFYTLREIVREIIQENRVLAAPKVLVDQHDHSGFFEQHPLGSISVEPQTNSSVSDKIHVVTYSEPNQSQITSEEHISSSMDSEHVVNGLSKVAAKDGTGHSASEHDYRTNLGEVTNSREQLPQQKIYEFEIEKIVNGDEVHEEDPEFDPVVTSDIFIHQGDCKTTTLLSNQKFDEPGNRRLSCEEYVNSNIPIVDGVKSKEFGQRTSSVAMEILETEKNGPKELEVSQATSHMNYNVVVEAFPLRPIYQKIHDIDEESDEVCETTESLEKKAIQHDKMSHIQSSTVLGNKKDEKKHPNSTLKLNGEFKDKNTVLSPQNASLESSNISTIIGATVLDVDDVKNVDSKDSLPDGTKGVDSTDSFISKNSTSTERTSSHPDNFSLEKEGDPMLDRINSETCEEASEKSIHHENNHFLALIKFISAFVKFWSE